MKQDKTLTATTTTKPSNLSLPLDGLRAGLLGGLPMDREYMAGVRSRARMLAKACAVKQPVESSPMDPYVAEVTSSR